MKSIKDLGPNEVIHCPTEEEASAIVQLMRENGGEWSRTIWDVYKEQTCYNVTLDAYCDINYYKRHNYTIHPAADFIYKENKNNKMTNQVTIQIPQGYEIDQDNSDLTTGIVKFKPDKKPLPTKWEDLDEVDGYYVETDCSIVDAEEMIADEVNRNIWPTKELAEASLALCQLVRLRDIYNDGWQADYTNSNQNKHSIYLYKNETSISFYSFTQNVLAFKDRETAELFSETFADLILQAKPLL